MRKILPLFLALLIFFTSNLPAFSALGSFNATQKTTVFAKIGEFYLSLYGWISPFASVVLTSDGIFIRAVVADRFGNFSISQVLIKAGFSHFCLTAVDFKRLGESETCFEIPPATGDIIMRDIFLPPTLGLSRSEINEGSSTKAYGYTMPGALVTLYLSNGQKLTTYADSTGYYEFTIKGLKAGLYSLYARAHYKNKDSLKPTKTLQLRSLSLWEQFIAFLKEIWEKILKFLRDLALGPLWLVVPLLIIITTLILRIWPEKFTFIYQSRLIIFFTDLFRKPKKHLHHEWFIGY